MQRNFAFLVSIAVGCAASAEELRPDTTGFYPMWETTGYVEDAGDVRVSTTGMQVGVPGGMHFGVQPVSFIERTPNAYAKVALPAPEGWHFAAQAAGYRLLAGAGGALFSPMYTTRLDNHDFDAIFAPLSFAASKDLASWLEVHQTVTLATVAAPGHLKTRVTPGYSVVVGLNPHGRHGVTFHAADVGFWDHDLAIAGASYRYRNGWMELRLGYFYRFTKSGTQGAPIAGFGVLL